jgi:hypothetical protein
MTKVNASHTQRFAFESSHQLKSPETSVSSRDLDFYTSPPRIRAISQWVTKRNIPTQWSDQNEKNPVNTAGDDRGVF